MKSILEEFYYGNIDPGTAELSRTAKYDRALEKIIASEEKLLKLLNEPEKLLFNEFSEAQEEMHESFIAEKFSLGFKLGVLFMTEVFTKPPTKEGDTF